MCLPLELQWMKTGAPAPGGCWLPGGPVWGSQGRGAQNRGGAQLPPVAMEMLIPLVLPKLARGWCRSCCDLKPRVFPTRAVLIRGFPSPHTWSRFARWKCAASRLSRDFTLLMLLLGTLCKGGFCSSELEISLDSVSTRYLIILASVSASSLLIQMFLFCFSIIGLVWFFYISHYTFFIHRWLLSKTGLSELVMYCARPTQVVQRLGFWVFTAMAQVQSLVGELRSCKLHSTVKKKRKSSSN